MRLIGNMVHYYVGIHISTAGEDAFAYVYAPASMDKIKIASLLQNSKSFEGDKIELMELTTRAEARKRGGDFHEEAFDNAYLILE